jgi:DNA-binding transcriptional ArsR family regulator
MTKTIEDILRSGLSDGAKVAAIAMLATGSRTAKEIAAATNRSLRSVERHYAELRTAGYADLRSSGTQICVPPDSRTTQKCVEDYADLRSSDLSCARVDNTTRANIESLRDEESVSSDFERESSSGEDQTRGEVARVMSDSGFQIPPEVNHTTAENNNKTLAAKLAKAEHDADPDDGDEGRYWAAVDVLAKAGVPRSQLVKLGKLIGEHDEALAVLRTVAAARAPIPYLAKIIRNREQEARQAAESLAGYGDEPEFVRDHRRDGFSPIYRRPDGNWEIGRWTFSPEGLEIGG